MKRAQQGPRNKGGRIQRNKGPPLAVKKLIVQQANKQIDVLSLCCDVMPLTHTANGVVYSVEHNTSPNTDEDTKTWIVDTTRENIKQSYEDAGWGWNDEEKSAELLDTRAQYLLVRDTASQQLVGFTHFRFDMDYGHHVLYCYEISVSSTVQSTGVGAWLMLLLQRIALASNVSKVVLTVGKNNPRALKFYFQLGYRVDETSPVSLKEATNKSYLILSRACKKDKKEEEEEASNAKSAKQRKNADTVAKNLANLKL